MTFCIPDPLVTLQIILAKFLPSWGLVLLSLIPTLIYFWSVSQIGESPGKYGCGRIPGVLISGLLFLGGIYAAIGIFASSLTGNQIIAFILAAFVVFNVRGFDFLSDLAGSGRTAFFISTAWGSVIIITPLAGECSIRAIFSIFLVVMGLFIMGTRTVLQSSKW